MRSLVVFSLFIFFFGCSEDSRNGNGKDSSIDTNTHDSSFVESDSSILTYENDSRVQDSSLSDSETDSIDYEDSGIEDSDILDSDIIDADLPDTDNKDAEMTDEELLTDGPTRIYLDVSCEEHYAYNKRCPEENCMSYSGGYNYTVGCVGKKHAHLYLCEAANPKKDDYKLMLLCTCACADIE